MTRSEATIPALPNHLTELCSTWNSINHRIGSLKATPNNHCLRWCKIDGDLKKRNLKLSEVVS
ncbi:CLUMA_CG004621, isoform A [Clunio marinus]|uniref:CLUMA_CG004621, isoform A n=1 Tax=Clunio marinus TaxID=568069 RepID=A0A1J1HU87_9DIPT|nr:CLUMA_CG004621, isoform A [Clunio marinus]